MDPRLYGAREVQRVLNWLPLAPSTFNSAKFVLSLEARLNRGLELTERQMAAIQSIISKFIDFKAATQRVSLPFRSPYYKTVDPLSHYY